MDELDKKIRLYYSLKKQMKDMKKIVDDYNDYIKNILRDNNNLYESDEYRVLLSKYTRKYLNKDAIEKDGININKYYEVKEHERLDVIKKENYITMEDFDDL